MDSLDLKLKKEIDKRDIYFVSVYEKHLQGLARKLIRYKPSSIDGIEKDFAADQAALKIKIHKALKAHGTSSYNMGRVHGHIEVREFRPKKLAAPPNEGLDVFVIPEEAIKAIDRRELVLAGDVSSDMITQVKSLMRDKLYATKTAQEVEIGIAKVLKSARDRGSLISTTESTYYYNRGRLSSFRQDGVEYVQFSAVMDMSTSDQCRSRHRLVMRIDDPRLAENTPPLHGRCRSILRPYFGEVTPDMLDWSKAEPLPGGWNQNSGFKTEIAEYIRPVVQDRSSSFRKKDYAVMDADLRRLPVEHLKYIEKNGVRFKAENAESSGFNPKTREIILKPGLEKGEAAHEVGHALEELLNVRSNPKFREAIRDGLENVSFKDMVLSDYKNVLVADRDKFRKFLTEYQARIKDPTDSIGAGGFKYESLTEYFAEGYRLFYSGRNGKLLERDPKLYEFIKELGRWLK